MSYPRILIEHDFIIFNLDWPGSRDKIKDTEKV